MNPRSEPPVSGPPVSGPPTHPAIKAANIAMGACLAVMATLVFTNVVLRYGFGKGIAASEELSRLLFVWMVFIGATAAYPAGDHMAFTSLVAKFRGIARTAITAFIHSMVVLTCALVGWGAWQQVAIGWQNVSVVLGYPVALLPLPALLCSLAIGVMALRNLVTMQSLNFSRESEVE